MAKLLDANGLAEDTWTLVDGDSPALVSGPALYPLEFWRDHRSEVDADSGVWLETDADPETLANVLPEIGLLAIRFGVFSDGRGLSLAVLLRTRYGYRGELRAVGAVHEDLVHYLRRCGFDSYMLEDDRDIAVAERALGSPRDAYQGSVIEPEPAFRRTVRS